VNDARCIHDFLSGQCAICRPKAVREPAPADREVWVLPTGEVFHRADCYILDATHEANLVRDTLDTPPKAVTLADARLSGLRRCEICSPDVR
jgi:hypothetical protein